MTLKNHDSDQLIETMTLLILVNTQCLQCGVLSIDLMIDQVKEPFLKKGLLMIPDGYDAEYIKETLSTEVDTTDVYRNLVVEGIAMIASSTWTNHLCISVMQEKFKTYLSTEGQVRLDLMVKEVLKVWEEWVEIKGVNFPQLSGWLVNFYDDIKQKLRVENYDS